MSILFQSTGAVPLFDPQIVSPLAMGASSGWCLRPSGVYSLRPPKTFQVILCIPGPRPGTPPSREPWILLVENGTERPLLSLSYTSGYSCELV